MNLAEQLSTIDILDIEVIDAETQVKTLHPKADRYITVATIDENKEYKQRHFKIEELVNNLDKLASLGVNTYISPNEFYFPKRSAETIRRLNALYTDMDLANEYKNYNISEEELDIAIEILRDEYFNVVIPEPTMIIKSGRGLHLYWKIEDLPKQGLPLWTLVQNKISEILESFTEDFKFLKVDKASKDCTRVLRLADTINLKNNAICKLETIIEENIYRLDEIIKEYIPALDIANEYEKSRKKPKTKTERKIVGLYTIYKLHHDRLQDIQTLQKLRNTGSIDYRRRLCFLYRYYSCVFTGDMDLAMRNTHDFNNRFIEPLDEKDVIQASNSAEKAYLEWCKNSEDDLYKPIWNSEENKYNVKGYNYSNKKLIKELEITIEEQRHMLTIISKEVKYERNNKRRRDSRRNENGLTPKQQELQDLKNKILEAQSKAPKKLSLRELGEIFNVSKNKIDRALKFEK